LRIAAPVLLIAAGAICYANGMRGEFVFDDLGQIVANDRIRHVWPIGRFFETPRPLVEWSFAVNHAWGRLDPRGYHLVNIAIHVGAGIVLFGLIRRCLTGSPRAAVTESLASRLALVVSLIWVVHPLQTQSVTYIVQRAESLMGLFYLVTLYAAVRTMGTPQPRRWYAVAVGACALGMLAKPVMVTAPIAVVLMDRMVIGTSFGEMFRRRWPLHAGLAATWLILFVTGVVQGALDTSGQYGAFAGFSVETATPLEYALTQPEVVLHYLRLAAWPRPLCLDYGWAIQDDWRAGALYLGALCTIAAATVAAARRSGGVVFCVAAFFLILAPTSSIVPIKDAAFEHRMYLPLAAVTTVIVVGAWKLIVAWVRGESLRVGLSVVCLAIVVALLGWVTIRRNEDYSSRLRMWESVASVRPQNARAHNNIGTTLLNSGDAASALDALRRAERLDGDSAEIRYNLGNALLKLGRTDEAVGHYEASIRLDPGAVEPAIMLANALSQREQWTQAAEVLRRAVRDANPRTGRDTLAKAHFNLANTLSRQGDSAAAIAEYRLAIARDPRHHAAHYGLGVALQRAGRIDEAVAAYRMALEMAPEYVPARTALETAAELQSSRR
jgi:tetratricopeptide (TPR) repeat protein